MNEQEQRFIAGAQLVNARAEVRRLQQLVERLEEPVLLGYADVAEGALEHLARMLDYPPRTTDMDQEPPSS